MAFINFLMFPCTQNWIDLKLYLRLQLIPRATYLGQNICLFQLYTVVQHVKHFNDVVEFGENQEFTDDIEYLLSGLKSNQPLNTRCLR